MAKDAKVGSTEILVYDKEDDTAMVLMAAVSEYYNSNSDVGCANGRRIIKVVMKYYKVFIATRHL